MGQQPLTLVALELKINKMIKIISLCLVSISLLAFPLVTYGADKLEPPDLLEIKVDGKKVSGRSVFVKQGQSLSLKGSALPNSEIYLYIFSDEPLLAKAAVDNQGYWSYVVTQALDLGQHRIEAETHFGNEISAKIELLKFEVTEGKLPQLNYTLIIAILIIIVAISCYVIWIVIKKKIQFR